MYLTLFICITGFILLWYGADVLVKGSSSLASGLGVTPIVIGLTVVAFGTSAPEFVVSLDSAITGKGMIAVGNVIGSNICNIALVLGLSAVLRPIASSLSVINREIPIMLGISLYLFFISIDSTIGRVEGITLFSGIIAYTVFNYWISGKEKAKDISEKGIDYEAELKEIGYVPSRRAQIIFIFAGIAGIIAGARMVVYSAVEIMTVLGASEKFIGLTIVAFGTSLPELATSVVAAFRKEMDISMGNLLGSNVFNILSVLGAASIIRPITIAGGFMQSGLFTDYTVMMITGLLPWFMMRKTLTVSRLQGGILLLCYSGYIIYLFIRM